MQHIFEFRDINPTATGPFHFEGFCSCGQWQSWVIFTEGDADKARLSFNRHLRERSLTGATR